MPLVRKPTGPSAATKRDAAAVLQSLASANADERWEAARAVVELPGGGAAVAVALRTENDPRVREAMFTSLARIGTADSIDAVIGLLRSDNANLRTGALDALRLMVSGAPERLPALLSDPDVDVRILSCELARSLPTMEAARLMAALIAADPDVNVCAAAVDVLAEVATAESLPALEACALKFRDSPFLAFAIKTVTRRLASQSSARA